MTYQGRIAFGISSTPRPFRSPCHVSRGCAFLGLALSFLVRSTAGLSRVMRLCRQTLMLSDYLYLTCCSPCLPTRRMTQGPARLRLLSLLVPKLILPLPAPMVVILFATSKETPQLPRVPIRPCLRRFCLALALADGDCPGRLTLAGLLTPILKEFLRGVSLSILRRLLASSLSLTLSQCACVAIAGPH